ncbi:MAG: SDR family oxidoreductase [Chloroflexi bacterium]|nr:SDR family oxidoreductase [Chloroflexota bacterium]
MRLKDKIAIVTGASRGIGAAIARGYASEGARVVLAARTLPDLQAVAAEINEAGGEALPIETDVTDEDAVKNMVAQTVTQFGGVDILVNNAGGAMWKPVWATSLNTWEWLIGVNLRGPFLGCKHVWRPMRERGGGVIINIGSTSGSRAYPYFAAYSASKWGLVGLTKSLAEEGIPDNIRVNVINPGKVDTAQRSSIKDEGPILAPEDLVGTAIFLASDEAAWMRGHVIELEAPDPTSVPAVGRRRNSKGG